MTKALFAALLALAAAPGSAGERYVLRNGRAAQKAPAAAPRPVSRAGGAIAGAQLRPETPSSAFAAGARRPAGGGSFWPAPRRFGALRVRARGVEEENSEAEAPPHFSKPGALIRTAGHRPHTFAPAERAEHRIDAGEIALDARRAHDVGRAPGLRAGPRDTLPPCTGCGSSGGITPNLVAGGEVRHNGAHDNENGGGRPR